MIQTTCHRMTLIKWAMESIRQPLHPEPLPVSHQESHPWVLRHSGPCLECKLTATVTFYNPLVRADQLASGAGQPPEVPEVRQHKDTGVRRGRTAAVVRIERQNCFMR